MRRRGKRILLCPLYLGLTIGFPGISAGKNLPAVQKTLIWFLGQEDSQEKDRQPTPIFWDFPGDSDSKESACNVGDPDSIPGLGRSPWGGHSNPLQYPCLENPHGQRSLVGYSPWGPIELDMTEGLKQHSTYSLYKKANSNITVRTGNSLIGVTNPGQVYTRKWKHWDRLWISKQLICHMWAQFWLCHF